jgi:hypothetical protein
MTINNYTLLVNNVITFQSTSNNAINFLKEYCKYINIQFELIERYHKNDKVEVLEYKHKLL